MIARIDIELDRKSMGETKEDFLNGSKAKVEHM